MRKWTVETLLALAISAWSTSAQAATISFDQNLIDPGGTLLYDGLGGPLTGAGILFDRVRGQGTPANAGVVLTCVGCSLTFETGPNTIEGPDDWEWAAGGFFNVIGTIPTIGIVAPSLLLGGTVAEAGASDGGLLFVQLSGPDEKHQLLKNFYGLGGYSFEYGNTEIEGNAVITTSGLTAGAITAVDLDAADITNVAQVPEGGSSMAFLGLGLMIVGTLSRKMLV